MGWDKTLPVGATSVLSSTTTLTGNFTVMEQFSDLEHNGLPCGSYPHRPGGCTALLVDTTANINAHATTAASAMAWDTTIKCIKYNNNGPFVNFGGFVPGGSTMIFYQDTSPTGWTIVDTANDGLVFITNGSALGGQTGGATHPTGTWVQSAHADHTHSDTGTVLEQATMPKHTHTCGPTNQTCGATGTASDGYPGGRTNDLSFTSVVSLAPCGAGQPHYHGESSSGTAYHTVWRPASSCCIFASKD